MRSVWRSVILALCISMAIAAVALFVIFRFLVPYGEAKEKQYEPQFVIGSWEGQVAVFQGQQEYPMQVFDVYVSALPEEARRQVLDGIPVEDEAQLSVLLEDYTS